MPEWICAQLGVKVIVCVGSSKRDREMTKFQNRPFATVTFKSNGKQSSINGRDDYAKYECYNYSAIYETETPIPFSNWNLKLCFKMR